METSKTKIEAVKRKVTNDQQEMRRRINFEFANLILRLQFLPWRTTRFVLLLKKIHRALFDKTIGSAHAFLSIRCKHREERNLVLVEKLIEKYLNPKLSSEFRKFVFVENRKYPYEISDQLIDQVWQILAFYNRNESLTSKIAKQCFVSQVLNYIGLIYDEPEDITEPIWNAFEDGVHTLENGNGDYDIRHIFIQTVIDLIASSHRERNMNGVVYAF